MARCFIARKTRHTRHWHFIEGHCYYLEENQCLDLTEMFGNPLHPFSNEPMTAEEYKMCLRVFREHIAKNAVKPEGFATYTFVRVPPSEPGVYKCHIEARPRGKKLKCFLEVLDTSVSKEQIDKIATLQTCLGSKKAR